MLPWVPGATLQNVPTMTSNSRKCTFPYVTACRTYDVLELDVGDVVQVKYGEKTPRLAKSGGVRSIIVRVEYDSNGFASKVVTVPMGARA